MTTQRDARGASAKPKRRPPTKPAHERYDIEETRRGTMAIVYLCRDTLLGRDVALKVPKAAYQREFKVELQTHAPLLHPNIMPILDQGYIKLDDQWYPYFTMPLYKNGPFGLRVREVHEVNKKLWSSAREWTLRRLVEAVQRIADALSFAHHNKVLHLDVSPKNILTGYTDAEVLLGDWGLSQMIRPPEDSRRRRRASTPVRGTPGFIAPEHLSSPGDWPTVKNDIYSLGALLYNVLGGQAPFAELQGDVAATIEAAKTRDPLPLEKVTTLPVPPTLAALTYRAMSRDPRLRPASANVISLELKRWLDLDPDGLLKPATSRRSR